MGGEGRFTPGPGEGSFFYHRAHFEMRRNLIFKRKILQSDYLSFGSVEESKHYASLHYDNWLKDFQVGGRFRNSFLYDLSESYIKDYEMDSNEYRAFCFFSLYCGGLYHYRINQYLRRLIMQYDFNALLAAQDVFFNGECVDETISLAISHVNKFPIQDNLVLYRLIPYSYFKTFTKGAFHTEYGFMSCGLVLDSLLLSDESYSSCDTILKLYVSKGVCGLYLDFISHRRHEQEMLLPPKTVCKVINKTRFLNRRLIECEVCSAKGA